MRLIILLSCLIPISCTHDKTVIKFAVGTYTQKEGHVDGKAEGIYLIELNDSLNIQNQQLLRGSTNPSYLTFNPANSALYAVNEMFSEQHQAGLVLAYIKNEDNTWQAQQIMSSMGAAYRN